MKPSKSYVLVLDQQPDDLYGLKSLLRQLKCPFVAATSTEQVMVSVDHSQPYLVILAGNDASWSQTMISALRKNSESRITIVALTDFHEPSWLHQDQHPGLDGFLVKPISGDVLVSLVQSAWARQISCLSS